MYFSNNARLAVLSDVTSMRPPPQQKALGDLKVGVIAAVGGTAVSVAVGGTGVTVGKGALVGSGVSVMAVVALGWITAISVAVGGQGSGAVAGQQLGWITGSKPGRW